MCTFDNVTSIHVDMSLPANLKGTLIKLNKSMIYPNSTPPRQHLKKNMFYCLHSFSANKKYLARKKTNSTSAATLYLERLLTQLSTYITVYLPLYFSQGARKGKEIGTKSGKYDQSGKLARLGCDDDGVARLGAMTLVWRGWVR